MGAEHRRGDRELGDPGPAGRRWSPGGRWRQRRRHGRGTPPGWPRTRRSRPGGSVV